MLGMYNKIKELKSNTKHKLKETIYEQKNSLMVTSGPNSHN